MTQKDLSKLAPILVVQNCPHTAEFQVFMAGKYWPEHRETLRECFKMYWGYYPGEEDPREVMVDL